MSMIPYLTSCRERDEKEAASGVCCPPFKSLSHNAHLVSDLNVGMIPQSSSHALDCTQPDAAKKTGEETVVLFVFFHVDGVPVLSVRNSHDNVYHLLAVACCWPFAVLRSSLTLLEDARPIRKSKTDRRWEDSKYGFEA